MPDAPQPPVDADERRAAPATVCYEVDRLPAPHPDLFGPYREEVVVVDELFVPPREARTFRVDAGNLFPPSPMTRSAGTAGTRMVPESTT